MGTDVGGDNTIILTVSENTKLALDTPYVLVHTCTCTYLYNTYPYSVGIVIDFIH